MAIERVPKSQRHCGRGKEYCATKFVKFANDLPMVGAKQGR